MASLLPGIVQRHWGCIYASEHPVLCSPLLCCPLAFFGRYSLHRRWLCFEGRLNRPLPFARAKEAKFELPGPNTAPHPRHHLLDSSPFSLFLALVFESIRRFQSSKQPSPTSVELLLLTRLQDHSTHRSYWAQARRHVRSHEVSPCSCSGNTVSSTVNSAESSLTVCRPEGQH